MCTRECKYIYMCMCVCIIYMCIHIYIYLCVEVKGQSQVSFLRHLAILRQSLSHNLQFDLWARLDDLQAPRSFLCPHSIPQC